MRPDAGSGRGRPRAARFLPVSSRGALLGARPRSAARGEGAPGGAQQVLSWIKRRFLHPASGLAGRESNCLSAAPTQRLVAVGRSATPPLALSAPPSPFKIFRGWVDGMEGSEGTPGTPPPPICSSGLSSRVYSETSIVILSCRV